jgi:hypothetical protein
MLDANEEVTPGMPSNPHHPVMTMRVTDGNPMAEAMLTVDGQIISREGPRDTCTFIDFKGRTAGKTGSIRAGYGTGGSHSTVFISARGGVNAEQLIKFYAAQPTGAGPMYHVNYYDHGKSISEILRGTQ